MTSSSPRTRGVEGAAALHALGLGPNDRALILGGYGLRNVGDEAILAGLLARLPDGLRVRVVSRAPEETVAVHGVGAVSPAAALAGLLESDALIVGGGGIFSRHMGLLARLIPSFCLLARMRGLRMAFHGVGIYPSTPAWLQQMLVWLAPYLCSFTVRDRASATLLRQRGIPVIRIADLSQAMPAAPSSAATTFMASLGLDLQRPVVGLCLTAVEPGLEGSLLEAVPQLIDALPEVQFCAVPMSHHPTVPRHNDLMLARRLRLRAPRLTVLETWHHPAQFLALFRHFDAVVGMRYHSLLFARRCDRPLIPIAYAEKCQDWLEEQGLAPVEVSAHGLVAEVTRALQGPGARRP